MKVSFIGPLKWSHDAHEGLRLTFDAKYLPELKAGCDSCLFELYRVVINDIVSGWIVTQKLPDELFVWCYQGIESDAVLHSLAAHATRLQLKNVGFFTHRKGFARKFARYMPDITRTEIDGEVRFVLSVKELRHASTKI